MVLVRAGRAWDEMSYTWCRGLLLQPEALCIHDCQLDPVQHFLLAAVFRQQQRVEAGVTCRQLVAVRSVSLDDALQGTQTTNWGPAQQQEQQQLTKQPGAAQSTN